MALYNVAAGVLPPGEVQYFLLAIASIISFVFIGAFDSPRTFAAASRQLSFPAVLAAGFFAFAVFVAFGALVVFFVDMVRLLRGGCSATSAARPSPSVRCCRSDRHRVRTVTSVLGTPQALSQRIPDEFTRFLMRPSPQEIGNIEHRAQATYVDP